jgi:aspartate kinase
VSVSITTDSDRNLNEAEMELKQYGAVTIEKNKAILCIVGEGLKQKMGVSKKIFGALADAKINVEMISQGATKINLSILVNQDSVKEAVKVLHKALFEDKV